MKKITFLFIVLLSTVAPFQFFAQQTVTSFSPTSGETGTTVTIIGTNFSPTLSNNVVTFNGETAIVTSATTTILTATVPNGATSGAVNVQISSDVVTSSSIFTVLDSNGCNGISNNNAKHWYFGNQAAVVFESNGPVALSDSAMSQVEGVATMSDANGNLLFYTNGITIYNRNNEVMVNGSGLTSNSSNTQAAFVVPFPGNTDKYYVITPGPYNYSIVDMTLDNGNGAVMATAKNISINTQNSEKVAGLLASNQTDIWLITYGASEMRFNVYKITPLGISVTPVISQFTLASGYFGYMKISPDGTKIVTANFEQTFHLYDFDAVTGMVSNQKVITFPTSIGGFGSYGIEFSPNSQLVYVSDHRGQNRVFQFNISLNSPTLIANSKVDLASNASALGALQLGPDNKIYLAKENSNHLGVINQPNVVGTGCQYEPEGVNLSPKTSNLGLPGFVASALVRAEPYIVAFSPEAGEIGETVTITGINFNTNPSNNFVSFNGIPTVVTAASETSLTVTVPNGATTGKISVEVGCGLVASTNDFIVNFLGIDEFKNVEVAVFPNPSSGIFNLQTNSGLENASISVFDINGRAVYQTTFKNIKTQVLDLTPLQNGIYMVKISNETSQFFRKIVKQ